MDKERVKAAGKYTEPAYSSDPDAPTAAAFGAHTALGWASAPLEALVDATRGVPYGIVKTGDPVVGGVPTVRCGDIKGFTIVLERLKRVDPRLHEQYSRTALLGGEVLVAVRGTVGATAVVGPEMIGMNISREVAMIPVLPGVLPAYLCYLLASPVGQRLMAGHVKGVAQSGINLGDLRKLPMPLPPLGEQAAIVTAVEDALSAIATTLERMRQQDHRLARLEQSILAKALRGELVEQDPTDEPASALLARIRAERMARESAITAAKKAAKKAAKDAAKKTPAR